MTPRRVPPESRAPRQPSSDPVEASDRRDAIEVFSVEIDADRHRGRSLVRARTLTMTPMDGTALPGVLYRPDGSFWGVNGVDGRTLAIRTETFISPAVARADAEELLVCAREFRYVPVRDATGRSSIWIVHDGRVVLVSGGVQRDGLRPQEGTLRRAITRVAPRIVPPRSGRVGTPQDVTTPAASETSR